ncbi:MFS transporter [Alicyclobacillus curvatus]|nr:MFS transporter [Alicyclobacillus curvatus]
MWGLLGQRNYRLLWSSQVVSQLGDAFSRVAILLIVAKAFHSGPVGISLILFADLFPSVLLAPISGVWGDRLNKKTVMVSMDVLRAAVITAILLTLPFHSILLTFVLMFIAGCGSAMYGPAKTAAIPMVVGEDHVSDAIGLSQSTSAATQVAGWALGGTVIGLFGVTAAFSTDIASYLLSALITVFLPRLAPVGNEASDSLSFGFFEGFSTIRRAPILVFLLIMLTPVTLALGVFNTTQNAILVQDLHMTAQYYGYNEAVFGIGSAVGGILGAMALRRFRAGSVLMTGIALCGVFLAAIAPVQTYYPVFGNPLVLLWSLLLGVVVPFINGPISSLFILATPAPVRARGAAVMQAVINASMLIGTLLGGLLGYVTGTVTLTWMSGIMLVLTAVVSPIAKGFRELQVAASQTRRSRVRRGAETPSSASDKQAESAGKLTLPTSAAGWEASRLSATIADMGALHLLQDPLNLMILAQLEDKQMEVEQVSRDLGFSHDDKDFSERIRRLEKHGFIHYVDEARTIIQDVSQYNVSAKFMESNREGVADWANQFLIMSGRRLTEAIMAAPTGALQTDIALLSDENWRDPKQQVSFQVKVERLTRDDWKQRVHADSKEVGDRNLQESIKESTTESITKERITAETKVREGASEASATVGVTEEDDTEKHTYVHITMSYRLDV